MRATNHKTGWGPGGSGGRSALTNMQERRWAVDSLRSELASSGLRIASRCRRGGHRVDTFVRRCRTNRNRPAVLCMPKPRASAVRRSTPKLDSEAQSATCAGAPEQRAWLSHSPQAIPTNKTLGSSECDEACMDRHGGWADGKRARSHGNGPEHRGGRQDHRSIIARRRALQSPPRAPSPRRGPASPSRDAPSSGGRLQSLSASCLRGA